VEDEENKAKQAVEDALNQRSVLDEQCKKIKARIKDNREKFKEQDREFGAVLRDESA
jgi:outer membrane protein TolC